MKQIVSRGSIFIVIAVFGTLGLSFPSAKQSVPAQIDGTSDRIGTSPDSGPLSLANAVVNPRKIDPKQPSNKYRTKSAFRYDRERVEVLARSVTFPHVRNQGEHMLRVDFPNTEILCLDAAYYAGRVQGLMWAMDTDTVMEHALHWTIDDAGDLFDTCLAILLLQAFADQNTNHEIQLKNVKGELAKRIQIIQEKLRKAQSVQIKGAGTAKGSKSYSQRGREKPGSGSD